MGQPPAAPPAPTAQIAQDPVFINDRKIRIPINYARPRNSIRLVTLWFSRDNGNTWERGQAVTSDKDYFFFTAQDDGQYWFTNQEEDLQGHKLPINMTQQPPDLKVIVKTAKPRIHITESKRTAEIIAIEWQVEDRYPNENATRVFFKKASASEAEWREVKLPPNSKSGVKFPSGTMDPVVVRVSVYDQAKNEAVEVHAFEAGSYTVHAMAPPAGGGIAAPLAPTLPTSPMSPMGSSPVMPAGSVITSTASQVTPAAPVAAPTSPLVMPAAPLPPPINPPTPSMRPASDPVPPVVPPSPSLSAPSLPAGLAAPAAPAANTSPAPYVPPGPPPIGSLAPGAGGLSSASPLAGLPAAASSTSRGIDKSSGSGFSTTPANPALAPVPPVVPFPAASVSLAGSAIGGTGSSLPSTSALPVYDPHQPTTTSSGTLPVWTGSQTPPAIDSPQVPVINYLTFDLGFEVEKHGPSGISRVDLWVTRDDGRTWQKWSQHAGKGATIRVNLNIPANPQPEGAYGFRVVPVSGAGLSEREPVAGDAPDLRVIVDVTPPQIDLYPPTGDPTSPDTLLIQWKATDKNWSDDPITIEWSDKPTGPWQPVAAGGDLVQTVAGTPPTLRHLANTGQYAWRVPPGLPPRVYLKVCARDAAGNVRQVITRDPILIDLVKPRAKINGIVPPQPPVVPAGAAKP